MRLDGLHGLSELSELARFVCSREFKNAARTANLSHCELSGVSDLVSVAEYICCSDFQNLSSLEQLGFFKIFSNIWKGVKKALPIAAAVVGGIYGGPAGATAAYSIVGGMTAKKQQQSVEQAALAYQVPQMIPAPPGQQAYQYPVPTPTYTYGAAQYAVPAQPQVIYKQAPSADISTYLPYMIGGGALLMVMMLMKK